MRTLIFSILALVFSTGQAADFDLMPKPDITISFDKEDIDAKTNLVVDITIDPAWYVSSNTPLDEYSFVSYIEVKTNNLNYKDPVYPKPIIKYLESLDAKTSIYKGTITIKVPVFEIKPGFSEQDKLNTAVTFHYQSCNNKLCLAPTQTTQTLKSSQAGYKPL